jgi:glucokinase
VHAIGIDIGGTKIAAGLVDDEGNLSGSIRIDTPREARAIEDAVVELVEGLRSGTEVAAVGVAAPGFIDREASVVYFTPNLPWRGEPLRDVLEARLDASVTIENDANAAGWAEYRFGAGRGRRDVVMLTLGTGVGGAIVIDGELYRGGHGAAAELGHIRLVTGGELCGCGQRGCLEQYASGRALQRIAGEIAAADPAGALAEARSADGIVHGADFARLVHAGDTGALKSRSTSHTVAARSRPCSIPSSSSSVAGSRSSATRSCAPSARPTSTRCRPRVLGPSPNSRSPSS